MPRKVRAATDGAPVHAGWLTKKGQKNKSFKRRWFVLWRGLDDAARPEYELCYFHDESSVQPAGAAIVLGHGDYTVEPRGALKKFEHSFELTAQQEGRGRTFTLASSPAEESETWLAVLQGLTFGSAAAVAAGPPASSPAVATKEEEGGKSAFTGGQGSRGGRRPRKLSDVGARVSTDSLRQSMSGGGRRRSLSTSAMRHSQADGGISCVDGSGGEASYVPKTKQGKRVSAELQEATQTGALSAHSVAGLMVSSIFEMLDKDGTGYLAYGDFAALGKLRGGPITMAEYTELAGLVGCVDAARGLDVHMLAEAYFHHSLGDCVADFERLLEDCAEAKKHRQQLKEKAKRAQKAEAKATPRRQLDLGKIKPEELELQRQLLEKRVLDWLSTIPIGGREERHYDPRPMVRFAESWNLFHLEVDEIYAKQIDAQMAEAEVEAMVSCRARGTPEVSMEGEEEEGRLFALMIKKNELVDTDKKLMLKAADIAALLEQIKERLGLPPDRQVFVTLTETGAEVLDLADIDDDKVSIQVWQRDVIGDDVKLQQEIAAVLGPPAEQHFVVTQTHLKSVLCEVELRVGWQLELWCEGALVQAIQLFSMPTSSGIQSISQCTGLKSGKLKLLTNDGETIILGSEDKQGREIAALLKQRAETVLTALKIDPDLSVAKLREGARLLWMSTTAASMTRGIAVVEESVRLDRTNLKAQKMLDLASDAKKEKQSAMEVRVEALFVAFEDQPEEMHQQAVKLAADCMKLGKELCEIYEMTRDKDDTRRAESYFSTALRLDPAIAEEAEAGRNRAIDLRRSRRQRAKARAQENQERRKSISEDRKRRKSAQASVAQRRKSLLAADKAQRRNSLVGSDARRSSISGAGERRSSFSFIERRKSVILGDQFRAAHRGCGDRCINAGELSEIPGQLGCIGSVQAALAPWEEAARDFTRTFLATADGSGDVMVMATPEEGTAAFDFLNIECDMHVSGDVTKEVTTAAVAAFQRVVAKLLTTAGMYAPRAKLTELVRYIVGHLTVTPSMQVLVDHAVSPAMYQNKFVLLVGSGQVRVATYGFIGDSVRGDRPDRKYTPHILRLLSPDLFAKTQGPVDQVRYTVRMTGQQTVEHLMQEDRRAMAKAVNTGDFNCLPQLQTMKQHVGMEELGGSPIPQRPAAEGETPDTGLDSLNFDAGEADDKLGQQLKVLTKVFPSQPSARQTRMIEALKLTIVEWERLLAETPDEAAQMKEKGRQQMREQAYMEAAMSFNMSLTLKPDDDDLPALIAMAMRKATMVVIPGSPAFPMVPDTPEPTESPPVHDDKEAVGTSRDGGRSPDSATQQRLFRIESGVEMLEESSTSATQGEEDDSMTDSMTDSSQSEYSSEDDVIDDLMYDHHQLDPHCSLGLAAVGRRASVVQEEDEDDWSSEEEEYDGMRRSLRRSARRASQGEDSMRASLRHSQRRGSKGEQALRSSMRHDPHRASLRRSQRRGSQGEQALRKSLRTSRKAAAAADGSPEGDGSESPAQPDVATKRRGRRGSIERLFGISKTKSKESSESPETPARDEAAESGDPLEKLTDPMEALQAMQMQEGWDPLEQAVSSLQLAEQSPHDATAREGLLRRGVDMLEQAIASGVVEAEAEEKASQMLTQAKSELSRLGSPVEAPRHIQSTVSAPARSDTQQQQHDGSMWASPAAAARGQGDQGAGMTISEGVPRQRSATMMTSPSMRCSLGAPAAEAEAEADGVAAAAAVVGRGSLASAAAVTYRYRAVGQKATVREGRSLTSKKVGTVAQGEEVVALMRVGHAVMGETVRLQLDRRPQGLGLGWVSEQAKNGSLLFKLIGLITEGEEGPDEEQRQPPGESGAPEAENPDPPEPAA